MYTNAEYNKIYELYLFGSISAAILDLLAVGLNKPIGYISLLDTEDISKYYSLEELSSIFRKNHLSTKVFPPLNQNYVSGTFYVWDNSALDNLLTKNMWILEKYNLATNSDEFVEQIATKEFLADEYPEVYALIAYAFADYDNSYLKDLNTKVNV